MAWLCPNATVMMAVPQKYLVEFYQPLQEGATNRVLMCGKMYSRHYIPMASGNGMRFVVAGSDSDNIIIAMLMLPEHRQLLVGGPIVRFVAASVVTFFTLHVTLLRPFPDVSTVLPEKRKAHP